MKKIILVFILFSQVVIAQNTVYQKVTSMNQQASTFDLFRLSDSNTLTQTIISPVDSVTKLYLNESSLKNLILQKPEFLSFSIPQNGGEFITLDLIPKKIHSENFIVTNSNDQQVKNLDFGIFYSGIIRGNESSLVAISITENGMSGFVSSKEGTYELGKINIETNISEYVYYNVSTIKSPSFECGVIDDNLKTLVNVSDSKKGRISGVNSAIGCRAVEIYLEADFSIFKGNYNNINNTVAYVNAVFSQVAVLYENEDIEIVISQIKVWDVQDPYTPTTETSMYLTRFTEALGPQFNGDLAHALTFTLSGGIASDFNGLCGALGFGMSGGLAAAYPNFPTYSWTVMVVTHELGHSFGSRHTHWCGWPGGAIDNCRTTNEPAPDGSNCPPGPAPVNGGTIMSYCHQISGVGINFANGFGTLPGNVIRNRVISCIGVSQTPTALTVSQITSKSVTLSWQSGGAEDNYKLEYRVTGASTWNVLTIKKKNVTLNDLTPNTSYQWRVKASCSSYANSTFTTNNTAEYCQVSYYYGCNPISINSVTLGGTALSTSTGCQNSSGYSYYPSSVKELAAGTSYNFTITFTSTYGRQAAIWIDLNGNKTFEESEKLFSTYIYESSSISGSIFIPGNSAPISSTRMRIVTTNISIPGNPCGGSYTYGETEDYLVNITNNNACNFVPANLAVSNVTGTGAQFSWSSTNPSLPFYLEYKRLGVLENWGIVSTNNTNYNLNSFLSGVTYQWRVRTSCSGYVNGENFTTIKTYCTSTGNGCSYDAINSVIVGGTTLSTGTGCSSGGYSNFPSPIKELTAGNSYDFTVSFSNSNYTRHVSIWIDLNNDTFFDPSERVYASTQKESTSISNSFTIPITTEPATVRMRIIGADMNPAPANPCITYIYGEVEDYTVRIVGSCPDLLTLQSPNDDYSTGTILRQASSTTGSITATNSITGNAKVTYEAKSVELKPGFTTNLGTVFRAQTGGCQ